MARRRKPDNRGSAGRANRLDAKDLDQLRAYIESRGLDWRLLTQLVATDVNIANIQRALQIKNYATARDYVNAYKNLIRKEQHNDHEVLPERH